MRTAIIQYRQFHALRDFAGRHRFNIEHSLLTILSEIF